MARQPLHLFEGFGVEIEYMIVDKASLDVRPIADLVLEAAAGEIVSEYEFADLGWSNELALHVIELKTNGPVASFDGLADVFQRHVQQINGILAPQAAQLMPTAAHPWMDSHTQLKLWPHDYSPVYEAYNRIFDCRGHGWANLQSVHLNLPFADADEFGRLHSAIRLVLPLLPALAASSPFLDGRSTGLMDSRLDVYAGNARKIPQVTGRVIPEAAFTPDDYQSQILQPMYEAISPYDPERILQFEWLNSRGAIARFDRNAIEIRLLDCQECPNVDIAICRFIAEITKALCNERWTSTSAQQSVSTDSLAELLPAVIRDADQAVVTDSLILESFGLPPSARSAGEIWTHLAMQMGFMDESWYAPVRWILDRGPLSRRILKSVGDDEPGRLLPTYHALCECLAAGRMFDANAYR